MPKQKAGETQAKSGGRASRGSQTKKSKKKAPSKSQLAAAELDRMQNEPCSQCEQLEGMPVQRAPEGAMRLGFAVKALGQPGLKSNDTRRWQQSPHLRVSLGYLCDIFAYLRKHQIHMYPHVP